MGGFSQWVLVVGRVKPNQVEMLGTGFIVHQDGYIITTHHVIGSGNGNLVILLPHIKDINDYQDLSDSRCRHIPATVEEIDPIRDLALLKADIKWSGKIPVLGSFDEVQIGNEVGVFGFPHCVEGRRALTFQKAEIGAKVLIESNGIKSKHAVINTQARPGQSGSLIFSYKAPVILGVLIGAWLPVSRGRISLGGINPRGLHQTTHCISAEYVRDML